MIINYQLPPPSTDHVLVLSCIAHISQCTCKEIDNRPRALVMSREEGLLLEEGLLPGEGRLQPDELDQLRDATPQGGADIIRGLR